MTLHVAGLVNRRQASARMLSLLRGRLGLAILAPTLAIAACSGSSSAWAPASALPGAAGATLNAVTTGSADTSLFVAGGTAPVSGETGHAAAWSSTDGKTWTQAPDIPSFSQAQFLAVAPGPSGFMAVGASCANGECGGQMAWTSIDGHTWLQGQGIASAPGIIPQTRTVIADGSGWIVGGLWFTGAADNHPPAIWTTTDGATWTAATLPDATDASGAALLSGVVTGVATSAARKVAVGSVDEGGGNRAAAWASADAQAWTPATVDPSFAGASMSAVVAGGPGFVAVGRNGDGAASWTSTDGTTWQPDASGPGFAGAQMTAIAASGGRLVAVGYDGTGALTWTSSDGRTWTQMTAPLRTWRVRRRWASPSLDDRRRGRDPRRAARRPGAVAH